MAMLEKLDTAARASASAAGQGATLPQIGTPSQSADITGMELDEALLEQMAEAAVPPAADGESAKAERSHK
eukprot:4986382-Karenia_brevis.AAC.1